jgi:chitin deacetylase
MKKRNNKKILFVLTAVLVLAFLCYGLLKISKSRTFQFFGGLVSHAETDRKVVALTFDDAPTAHAIEPLKVLEEKEVKATFFVIGKNIEENPEIAKQIVKEGHQLANHSYTHQRLIVKTLSFIEEEIEKTNDLIRDAGYRGEIVFRPPNGKKMFVLPWYLKQKHIKTIMWDVEPDTYFKNDTQKIVDYTIENTHCGSIILMHPFCENNCAADREALPQIIDRLKYDGYTFATVNELLGL